MKNKLLGCVGILGLLLVASLPFSGAACNAMDYATPDERTALDAIDGQIDAKKAEVEASEQKAKEVLSALEQLAKDALEVTTAEERAAIEQRQTELLAELLSIKDLWEVQLNALDALSQQAAQIEQGIAARQTDAVGTGAGAISPVAGLWVALLGPLAGRFLFKRSREHLLEAGRRFLKLGLGESIEYLAKSYGLTHSSESWDDLLERSIAAAREAGDDERVTKLKVLRDAMFADETAEAA